MKICLFISYHFNVKLHLKNYSRRGLKISEWAHYVEQGMF